MMKSQEALKELEQIGMTLQYEPKLSIAQIDNILENADYLNREVYMKALYLKGCAFMFLELNDELFDIANLLRSYAEKHQDLITLQKSYNLLGISSYNRNDFFNALLFFKNSYDLAVENTDHKMSAVTALNLAEVFYWTKQYAAAEVYAHRTLEAAFKQNEERLIAKAHARLAYVKSAQNDFQAAQVYLAEADSFYKDAGEALDLFYFHMVYATVTRHRDHFEEALSHLKMTKIYAQKINLPRINALLEIAYAEYNLDLGKVAKAKSHLEQAKHICETIQCESVMLRTLELLIEVSHRLSDLQTECTLFRDLLERERNLLKNIYNLEALEGLSINEKLRWRINLLTSENLQLQAQRKKFEEQVNQAHVSNLILENIETAYSMQEMVARAKVGLSEYFLNATINLYQYSLVTSDLCNLEGEGTLSKEDHQSIQGAVTSLFEKASDYTPINNRYSFGYAQLGKAFYFMMSDKHLAVIIQMIGLGHLDLSNEKVILIKKVITNLLSNLEVEEKLQSDTLERKRRVDMKMNAYHLSERELQIIDYVCKGLNNTEVSKELNLSSHTIRNHLSRIYSKVNVTGRYELMKLFS